MPLGSEPSSAALRQTKAFRNGNVGAVQLNPKLSVLCRVYVRPSSGRHTPPMVSLWHSSAVVGATRTWRSSMPSVQSSWFIRSTYSLTVQPVAPATLNVPSPSGHASSLHPPLATSVFEAAWVGMDE
eukprot:6287861-Prymnesium_polylepis.1